LIVKWSGSHWLDELGRIWDSRVNLRLPDRDLFAIDAVAPVPVAVPGPTGAYTGVGTILYNIAVNPVSGHIYVSNTEALNHRRFEGPGLFAGHTVRGHHNENRITVIDGTSVRPRHLNKHIDYSLCCAPVPNAENALSLALPMGMAVSSDGRTLYVAAMGSSKVGVFDTQALEDDTFQPNAHEQIAVSGGGPTGLVLNDSKNQLYVLTRFDNSISVVHTGSRREIQHLSMLNAEPSSVTSGRRFLYDASFTSSHGDSACATCHVFGDTDSLAWDLGNPDDATAPNLNPLTVDLLAFPADPSFLPMKGPLTTQSLRGLANHGPMHWRGDRTGASDEPTAQPDGGAFDEDAAFRKFQLGIVNLLGRQEPVPDGDMQAFADFILQVTYPPNPIRRLDNSLTLAQALGRDIFFNRESSAGLSTCEGCHRLDAAANAAFGVPFPGFFGTDGRSSRTGGRPHIIKVPHLRNLYQKVGMFGFPNRINFVGVVTPVAGLTGFMGDQVRGFGFLSAGDFDTIVRFHNVLQFDRNFPFAPNPEGFAHGEAGNTERRLVEAFVLAFDTNHAPMVGQQVTLRRASGLPTHARITAMMARAEAGECDLVAKAGEGAAARGYLYVRGGTFTGDRTSVPAVPELLLRVIAALPGQETTYTCVPVGSGRRIGIDRDVDGMLDGDETPAADR
jgi:DNA-binding beta-propeller fold protein YncE